jgi:hypothetical protein
MVIKVTMVTLVTKDVINVFGPSNETCQFSPILAKFVFRRQILIKMPNIQFYEHP